MSMETPSPAAFEIVMLSDSPEGFAIETANALGRTEGTPDNLVLTEAQRQALGSAYQGPRGELEFNGVGAVRAARAPYSAARQEKQQARSTVTALNLENDADRQAAMAERWPADAEAQLLATKGAFLAARAEYQNRGKKAGVRNPKISGDDPNTVSVDTKMVSFPVYNQLARPGNSEAVLGLSEAVGTAMVLKTADDRLVIQHRAVSRQRLHEPSMSRGNATYNDIPGASVAGLVDATLKSEGRKPGTADPISTETLRANIVKESGEELGLDADHMGTIRIAGVVHDNIKPHSEFVMLADSTLTADEIRETSRTSKRNKNLGDADFEEKFIDIPATPQAIETLLTDVKCPLPPTHAAAMLAAGYSLVVQREGAEAAHNWRAQVEAGVQANYQTMDQMVADFYTTHPEALAQVPERFWGKSVPPRNEHGYDPAYAPNEQGLPDFEDEMVRAGLSPERRTQVEDAWLFDVDGPISDPQEKRVVDTEILGHIVERLQAGEPVGFNTGRSLDWISERVLPSLMEQVTDPALLKNFVVIGEMGGTWLTFDEAGTPNVGQSKYLTVPAELQANVSNLVDEKYSGSMFVDPGKHTMLSVEMHDGHDLADYKQHQPQAVADIRALVAEAGLEKQYPVDGTTIAIDVASPHAGKALGADRFLQFIRDRGIKPSKFKTFGDSRSDMAMAEELNRRGQNVDFVFVGDPAALNGVERTFTIETMGGFSKGTDTYLKRIQAAESS
jgi:hypothetical protein